MDELNEKNKLNKKNKLNELNVKGLRMGPLGTFAHLPAGGAGAFGA